MIKSQLCVIKSELQDINSGLREIKLQLLIKSVQQEIESEL